MYISRVPDPSPPEPASAGTPTPPRIAPGAARRLTGANPGRCARTPSGLFSAFCILVHSRLSIDHGSLSTFTPSAPTPYTFIVAMSVPPAVAAVAREAAAEQFVEHALHDRGFLFLAR